MNKKRSNRRIADLETPGDAALQAAVRAKSGAKRIRLLKIATQLENIDAKFTLGCCYRDGRDIGKDYWTAMKLFLQVAKTKTPKVRPNSPQTLAMVSIGRLYHAGKGVRRSVVIFDHRLHENQRLKSPHPHPAGCILCRPVHHDPR